MDLELVISQRDSGELGRVGIDQNFLKGGSAEPGAWVVPTPSPTSARCRLVTGVDLRQSRWLPASGRQGNVFPLKPVLFYCFIVVVFFTLICFSLTRILSPLSSVFFKALSLTSGVAQELSSALLLVLTF